MKLIHVAVGVVINPQRQILVAKRPAGKPYAGYWEFPGGKLEQGENVQQALTRELQEEVNITPTHFQPLIKVERPLANKQFLLDTWLITDYTGELNANELQQLAWINIEELQHLTFLPANEIIIEKLIEFDRDLRSFAHDNF